MTILAISHTASFASLAASSPGHGERDTLAVTNVLCNPASPVPGLQGRPRYVLAVRARKATGLRVLLAAVCCPKGDWPANLAAHDEVLRQARDEGCHLAVFPEMSLTGSVDPGAHPGHLLRLESEPVQSLAELTRRHSVAAVFGLAEQGDRGACHITQAYARAGRLAGAYRKRHLGEDEGAYTPGTEQALFRFGQLSFGIAICAEGGVDYPFDEPAAAGAEVIFFCAAPGLYGRRTDDAGWRAGHSWWESCGLVGARRHAARTGVWVALATQAGSAGDEDFPGLAALVAPGGEVVARLPDWRAGTLAVDLPLSVTDDGG
jgi:NAD+ synthase (glutamine-hydrolysing)